MKIFRILLIAILFSCFSLKAITEHSTDIEDQEEISVTVYNSNIGLIKDVREVYMERGEVSLKFMDVASQINTKSVQVKSLTSPHNMQILEQNYEYDLMNYSKMMDKFVGKKVKLLTTNEFKDKKEVVEAKLMSYNSGQPIYKIDNEIHLGHSGRVILPEIPENLIATPTLIYLLDNNYGRTQKLQATYLTGGINWIADYVMEVSEDDKECDINGWVTINNTSGATYKDAKLKLVAGEVHRVEDLRDRTQIYAEKAARQAGAPQFEEEEFFEYHLYKLNRKSTLKNNQEKQIQLLEAKGVSIDKELVVYGISGYYTRRYREKIPKQDVNVYLSFKNSKDNRMGMALPKGTIRIYKPDSDGMLQFIGEDRIDHTPENEIIRVKVGKAFDVVCERTQTDYSRISDYVYETSWEITLRNHKEEETYVSLIEPLWGDWEVISSSHKYEKVDAHTIKFRVNVKPEEEEKVTYTVRVTY